jgi:hypothetical protein
MFNITGGFAIHPLGWNREKTGQSDMIRLVALGKPSKVRGRGFVFDCSYFLKSLILAQIERWRHG